MPCMDRIRSLGWRKADCLSIVDGFTFAEEEVSCVYPSAIKLPIDMAIELPPGEEVVCHSVEGADGRPPLRDTTRSIDEEGDGGEVVSYGEVYCTHSP